MTRRLNRRLSSGSYNAQYGEEESHGSIPRHPCVQNVDYILWDGRHVYFANWESYKIYNDYKWVLSEQVVAGPVRGSVEPPSVGYYNFGVLPDIHYRG